MIRPAARGTVAVLVALAVAAGCQPAEDPDDVAEAAALEDLAGTDLFDAVWVHRVSLTFDESVDVDVASADGEWIEGTVAIDGETYEQVGLRREELPSTGALAWHVQLDHRVDGRAHQGVAAFVVGPTTSESGIPEAAAQALLVEAGLADRPATPVQLVENDGPARLRLAVVPPRVDLSSLTDVLDRVDDAADRVDLTAAAGAVIDTWVETLTTHGLQLAVITTVEAEAAAARRAVGG